MEFTLRSYSPDDAEALGQIFYRAVHEGAAAKYTPEERNAWLPAPPSHQTWADKLAQSDCVVAEAEGRLVGFMSRREAYFDMAYVLPDVMGSGVAGVLCAVLEGRARASGVTHMTVEASHLAEPFFAKRGWKVVSRQTVQRRGVEIANCLMEKALVREDAAA